MSSTPVERRCSQTFPYSSVKSRRNSGSNVRPDEVVDAAKIRLLTPVPNCQSSSGAMLWVGFAGFSSR